MRRTGIETLAGKRIHHVMRLANGLVALQDKKGKILAQVAMDTSSFFDGKGHLFNFTTATTEPAPAPARHGTGRFEKQKEHDCPESPFGYCVGDTHAGESPCVFCGQPEERL